MVKEVKVSHKSGSSKVNNVLLWVLSIAFLFASMGVLTTSFLSAICYLLAGLLVLPPMTKWLVEKKNIKIKTWIKVVAILFLLMFSSLLSTSPETSSVGVQNQVSSDNVASSNANSCTPNWDCTEWTNCSMEGYQTRSCYDSNSCGTSSGKPIASQTCQYNYKIGDSIQAGDFTWKITNVKTSSQVGQDIYGTFLGQKADGIYIILSVEVTNTGKSAQYLMDSFLKLVDSQGREFSPDTTAAFYLGDNQAIMFDQINPGITKKGKIVYDVPAELKTFNLKISSNLVSDSFSNLKFAL